MHAASGRHYVAEIICRLKRRYSGEMGTRLHHSTAWQLLVATMLSAQAMDSTVNAVTHSMFKAYKKPEDFSKLRPVQLYKFTRKIGLYRSKSRNIIRSAKIIVEQYDSKVPKSISELTKLPGVGRKTANVVLANVYGINEGIAIDTHCITVSNRLGIVRTKDPAKIEQALIKVTPREEWGSITHLFIALGRDVCTARAKHCERCVLNDICPSSTVKVVK
ncbi:MAG: endonuclease III [Candidatus Micrarchaeia archaeon]